LSPAASPASPTPQTPAEQFFAFALQRIPKFLLAIAALLVVPIAWLYGIPPAAGFAVGALLSWFNFRLLARGVEALGDRIVDRHSRERGHIIVVRFLLRYLLVALIAYAIFKGSLGAFRGFLFGVCTPVAAMMMEAAYEAYMALRRGY
jgi:ATP synthase I chain